MEKNNSTSLLLRLSTDLNMGEPPPKLLTRMTTPPLRKRRREPSNELSERWKSSGRESIPVSKPRHMSLTSWTSGLGRQTRTRERPSIHTLQKSTPSLLSRMRTGQLPEEPPTLLERIFSPSHSRTGRESERKLMNSWTRYQGKNLKKMRSSSASLERGPRKRICLGSAQPLTHPEEVAALQPAEPSSNSAKIYQGSSHSCELPTTSPMGSPPHSGTKSFEVNLSTSIRSSLPCTLSKLMKRERVAWEELRLFLPWQSPNDRSRQEEIGRQHIEGCQRQLFSSSPTAGRNYPSMPSISKASSLQNMQAPTPKSSCTTSQSGIESEEDRTLCSPTTSASTVSAKQYCTLTELNTREVERDHRREERGQLREARPRRKPVEDSTVRMDAGSLKKNVIINIPAQTVEREGTERHLAPLKSVSEVTDGMRPKYLRYNIWDPDSDFSPSVSDWTLTAEPLEDPPCSALDDEAVTKTLHENPHLFKIVTPVHVKVFEAYLTTHPNQPFVKSICKGLREGFWPWAETPKPGYPTTNDESKLTPMDAKKAEFLRAQHDIELAKGRFSPPFTHGLLPGMYCMPIYAVPKPHSSALRLVTDQSYGKYSPNSMVKHEKVTGFPLDNMVLFGEMLMDLERREPGVEKVVWKSDIAEAYRILPMHPRWQAKQVTRIDDDYHVDRCNVFGGCGAGGIFISFNAFVMWIAKEIKRIRYLSGYVDDSSGCGRHDDHLIYKPYGKDYPRDRVTLLNLWDELGIPHKPHKQINGSPLPVIGITVDANQLSLTLSDEAREALISELRWWCKKGRKEKVRKWYQMGGWMNWAFNVYPRVRPALNNFYPKLKGRRDSTSVIWVNNSIRDNFSWAIRTLESSSGVHLLKSIYWGSDEATLTVFCDACPAGMGFWYPELNVGFYSPTPCYEHPDLIFYFEALCVHSALVDCHHRTANRGTGRFIIYTDNSNTVDIFSSLQALPPYNHLLKMAMDILNLGDSDMRVLHISGVDNAVADALSRSDFQRAIDLVPSLKISPFEPWSWSMDSNSSLTFQPPRGTLGVDEL